MQTNMQQWSINMVVCVWRMPWRNIHNVDGQWGSCHGGWSSSQLVGGTRPETGHISHHLPSSLPTWEYMLLRFETARFWSNTLENWIKLFKTHYIKLSIKRGLPGTRCCLWLRQLSIVYSDLGDLSVGERAALGPQIANSFHTQLHDQCLADPLLNSTSLISVLKSDLWNKKSNASTPQHDRCEYTLQVPEEHRRCPTLAKASDSKLWSCRFAYEKWRGSLGGQGALVE